ncbi:MAG TPA: hypothetical protein VGM77_11225 [Gemmatimonadales bacterium]|jgi:hypothetical protein
MKNSQPLRTFLKFFGSKYRATPRYPAPTHHTIIEPFAGGAGFSIRHHQRQVILIEKDPVIASVWRYLIGASSAEIRQLPLLSHDQSVHDLALIPEARDLIGFWLKNLPPLISTDLRQPSRWICCGAEVAAGGIARAVMAQTKPRADTAIRRRADRIDSAQARPDGKSEASRIRALPMHSRLSGTNNQPEQEHHDQRHL